MVLQLVLLTSNSRYCFQYSIIGHCSNRHFDGLAFVGHFKEGIPIGFCWKGLVGGSWIYGQVDERGEFTGIAPTI